MKTTVLPAARLTSDHLAAWSRLQHADPELVSPFFRPEFTIAVAAARDDVEVAVLEEGGEPVGFFPFQRGRWGTGRPVGGRLSDYQGVIVRPGVEWTAEELLRSCRLTTWHFDHLVPSQQQFASYHYTTGPSPFIDVSRGFKAYRAERNAAGSDVISQSMRRMRKLEREVGPLRFEAHSADPRVFAALLKWKSEQYRSTRVTNVFAFDWTVRLLERILGERDEPFAGMLAVLYAGDRIAAVELGLRSYGVLHGWFPAYNRELAEYSPGTTLQMVQVMNAHAIGVNCLDLGRGMVSYKSRFMTGATVLAEGCATARPLAHLVRHGWHRSREWLRSGPLRSAVRVAGRLTRPLRGWLAFR